MSKGNTFETQMLQLVFEATALPWNASTNLDIHLHTADPGEAGTSTTSEATYTGYAVATVARSAAGWTVTGDTATNDATIQWPLCTGGSNTCTHASVTPAGQTTILYSGALSSPIAVSNGIRPQADPGTLTVSEN